MVMRQETLEGIRDDFVSFSNNVDSTVQEMLALLHTLQEENQSTNLELGLDTILDPAVSQLAQSQIIIGQLQEYTEKFARRVNELIDIVGQMPR